MLTIMGEFGFPQKERPICEGISAEADSGSINWVGGSYYVGYLLFLLIG